MERGQRDHAERVARLARFIPVARGFRGARLAGSGEMLLKEGLQLVEGDQISLIIEIDVIGAGADHQLFGFCRLRIGIFAEMARMRFLARDQQHGAG